MSAVCFYSPICLEPWDFNTPNTTGIGGSETSHIELAKRFALSGYETTSFNSIETITKSPEGVIYYPLSDFRLESSTHYFVYRDPQFFDNESLAGLNNKYYFIAQDVDYDWNPTRLSRIDRYICLCQTHARYTLNKYPALKGRIIISSNGIDSEGIGFDNAATFSLNPEYRNPKHLMYASSPDRGLLLILENWFRIKERVPEAELSIYYGFNNMDTIIKKMGGNADLEYLRKNIETLMHQPGIHWKGRKPQSDIHMSWRKAGVFFYPSNWPETSCISIMEAQACGAIPVINRHWAQGENCLGGINLTGNVPQEDDLMKVRLIRYCCDVLNDSAYQEEHRPKIMQDALDTFSWDKVYTQMVNLVEGK